MKTTAVRLAQGFSLVEVVLALGVAAFCLLALFGLLPIGLNSNRASIEQTAAASMAASVVADLRATPPVSPASTSSTPTTSPQFGIQIPSTSTATSGGQVYTLFLKEDGTMAQQALATTSNPNGWSANLSQNPRYRVTLVFAAPVAGQLTTTPVRILVTWPPTADPNVATSLTDANFPSKFSGSFETVTALNRH